MTNEQAPLFYSELAALSAKYDVAGIVGIWFSATTDNYGFIQGAEQGNLEMTMVVTGLVGKLQEFCDQSHKGPTTCFTNAVGFKITKQSKP